MAASAKWTSSPAILHRRVSGWQRRTGLILMLHDTTEFTFKRDKPELIGITKTVNTKGQAEWLTPHTLCGILMHSSLAVTSEGVPLELAAVKFWTRKKFKGTAALKKKINPTRVPIEKKESVRRLDNLRQATELAAEPGTCVHIDDRESDIMTPSARPGRLGHTFWCGPASIAWLETAITR